MPPKRIGIASSSVADISFASITTPASLVPSVAFARVSSLHTASSSAFMSFSELSSLPITSLFSTSRGAKNNDYLGGQKIFNSLRRLCEEGQLNTAYCLVEALDRHGTDVSTSMLFCVLQGCIIKKNLDVGRRVQNFITKKKLQSSSYLGSHLIRLFAFCGSLLEAQQIFDQLKHPNVFAWSEIISAHAKLGKGEEAIKLYHLTRRSGLHLDGHVFVAALQACASLQDLSQGKLIHKHITESGLELNSFVACSLVDMYVQCAKLTDAFCVFKKVPAPGRNVVLWNAMIAGYAQQGHIQVARKLLERMGQEGLQPNTETWNGVISGCAQNGYAKEALKLLQSMEDGGIKPNNVTWNGMIAGFTQHGNTQEALQVFEQMQQVGTEPNQITFMSILKACYSSAALNYAKLVHAHMIETGCRLDAITWNSMIKMYTRCGNLNEACEVFDRLPERGVEAWNSMILGYARLSKHELTLTCYENMRHEGVDPDLVTFGSLLSACSHLGLVHEGCHHFTSMREEHGVTPIQEHVNCMVDLLGRAGKLMEAEDLLWTMPFCPDTEAWRSLLTHCRTHSDVELGRQCYGSVVAMDKKDSAGYVLMSNIYAAAGMQEDAEQVEEHRLIANAIKKPGKAYIEVYDKVHDFMVGDKSHPKSKLIYAKLRSLRNAIKGRGLLPSSLDESKEDTMWEHCEKLAVSFGLISLPVGVTIRISKNIRICADCHDATKLISKIEKRSIIIADPYRVHEFFDGACSCDDFF